MANAFKAASITKHEGGSQVKITAMQQHKTKYITRTVLELHSKCTLSGAPKQSSYLMSSKASLSLSTAPISWPKLLCRVCVLWIACRKRDSREHIFSNAIATPCSSGSTGLSIWHLFVLIRPPRPLPEYQYQNSPHLLNSPRATAALSSGYLKNLKHKSEGLLYLECARISHFTFLSTWCKQGCGFLYRKHTKAKQQTSLSTTK